MSRDGTLIFGPWISITFNPISPPILVAWISIPTSIFCPYKYYPIPGISIFGFLISIPA